MFNRISGWAVVASCVLLAVPTVTTANMLANPGFEAPDASAGDVNVIDGWSSFNDPNLSWVTRGVPPHSGLQSLNMFGPWNAWGGVGVTQAFPAAAGQVWVAEVYSLNSSADPMGAGNFCAMKIEFLDAGMGPAGGAWAAGINVFEVIVANESSPLDTWEFFGVGTAPAPAGTAFAQMVLVEVQGEPVTGGSVFLDDASFVPEPASVALLALGGLMLLRRRR